jgi:hypothetical protein
MTVNTSATSSTTGGF